MVQNGKLQIIAYYALRITLCEIKESFELELIAQSVYIKK